MMEAKICHNMPSTSWRLRKVSGIIQTESKAWEPGELIVKLPFQDQRTEKRGNEALMSKGKERWTSQLRKKENLLFLCLFVLFGSAVDRMLPTRIGEGGSSLLSLIQILISSRSTLTGHREIMFYRLSKYPLAQSSWPVKLTIAIP